MEIKKRKYCLTINNYVDSDIQKLQSQKYKYLIIGDEVGESGTPHLQVYIVFQSPKSFTTVKNLFPTAHIEVARGTDEQNRQYCSKQCVMLEDGEIGKQGRRSDIESTYEFEPTSMRDFLKTQPNYQNIRIFEKRLTYEESKRSWKSVVHWYYGPTGTGKSRAAHEATGGNHWKANQTAQWFDGYDGHENVIIDDMRADFCKLHYLLNLFDRYDMQVPVKGGFRQWKPKHIYVTTTKHPEEMYLGTGESIRQLLRRIEDIKYFDGPRRPGSLPPV